MNDSDNERLLESHRKLNALPKHLQFDYARRLSRSYSAGEKTLISDGATIEDGWVIWPDGEKFPRKRK